MIMKICSIPPCPLKVLPARPVDLYAQSVLREQV